MWEFILILVNSLLFFYVSFKIYSLIEKIKNKKELTISDVRTIMYIGFAFLFGFLEIFYAI